MIIQCAAIVGLTILESIALRKNVNGKLFALVAAIIGGIAGYTLTLNPGV